MKLQIGWERLMAIFSQVHCAKGEQLTLRNGAMAAFPLQAWPGGWTSAPWLGVCKLKP